MRIEPRPIIAALALSLALGAALVACSDDTDKKPPADSGAKDVLQPDTKPATKICRLTCKDDLDCVGTSRCKGGTCVACKASCSSSKSRCARRPARASPPAVSRNGTGSARATSAGARARWSSTGPRGEASAWRPVARSPR